MRAPHPELDPATYGFGERDMDRPIFINYVLGLESATLREIIEICQQTYCGSIGVEFMHIQEPEQKAWIQERIEGIRNRTEFTDLGKHTILQRLTESEIFERFLDKKYTGTKRFGLDGGESVVPAIEQILKRGGQLGVEEIIIGMAHRGRLNFLANVMRKPYRAIFSEFQGNAANPEDVQGSGDVKYHLGSSADRDFAGDSVHLSLTANPSHLEAVNPVVLGKVRAKQHQRGDGHRTPRHGSASAWRCSVCRPGCRRGNFRDVAAQGVPHRRHDPLCHQQSDRLHDQPGAFTLISVLLRCRQDGRRTHFPCERATTLRLASMLHA